MTASAQLPPMRGGIAGATTEAGAYGGSRAAPPYPQVSSATVFRRFHGQWWPGCVSKRFAKGVESGEIHRGIFTTCQCTPVVRQVVNGVKCRHDPVDTLITAANTVLNQ